MFLDPALFPTASLWAANLLFALALILALRHAPWGRLRRAGLVHVFLGAAVVLLVLWHLRAPVQPGLVYHLLGLTAVTLIFGWALALVAASLAMLGVYLNGAPAWPGFGLNMLLGALLPISLTWLALVLIRWYLPKQFFIYVLGNAFLTAGLVGAVMGYAAAGLLVASGAYSYAELAESVLPFFPLMFLPEAMLNGWIMVILVAFRPHWVYSFSDEQYIHGK